VAVVAWDVMVADRSYLRHWKIMEKEVTIQEEHDVEAPKEEIEERSEEDQKTKDSQISKEDKNILELQPQEKREEVKPYVPKLPYPQRFKEENKEKQYLTGKKLPIKNL